MGGRGRIFRDELETVIVDMVTENNATRLQKNQTRVLAGSTVFGNVVSVSMAIIEFYKSIN